MITYPYKGLQEFPVKDKTNLFQTGRSELTGARNIMMTARRILQVSDQDTKVVLVGEESNIIKLEFYEKKILLMYMYYIPKTHRLDIYDESDLICAYERKKCIYSKCSEGLKRFGFEDIFKSLVSLT